MKAPSPGVALMRGLTRRCPRCGRGKLFRRWVKMVPRCPRCGLRFEREEGAFLGSLTINYALSGLLGVIVMVVWFALTLPDTEVVPMMIGVVAVVIAGVPLFYPFAKTSWAALDLITHGADDEPSAS